MNKFILLLLPFSLVAGEVSFIRASKLYLEAGKSIGTNRHWTIPRDEQKEGTLGLTLELTNPSRNLFIRSQVDSFYTNKQFRYVSLEQEIALEPWKKGVELYGRHKSEHALDWRYEAGYPNQNEIGVRFKFIDR